jgi:hypothetical protein
MVESLHAAFATAMVLLIASPATQRKARNIRVGGMSFAYVDLGSGPTVVLIHGSISDYREWSKQMEALAKHHRVIAYSRRYHWPNSPPGEDTDATVPRQVEDLVAIINSLGLAPTHIVGHSYGYSRTVPCAAASRTSAYASSSRTSRSGYPRGYSRERDCDEGRLSSS